MKKGVHQGSSSACWVPCRANSTLEFPGSLYVYALVITDNLMEEYVKRLLIHQYNGKKP